MEKIDWDEAPEWAVRVVRIGMAQNIAWSCDSKYQYLSGDGPFLFFDDPADGFMLGQTTLVESRPATSPSWTGEGLPPIGVRCQAAIPHTSGPDNERSFIWIEGSVIAYYEIKGRTYAWFAEDDGFYPPNVLEFRPIRTPEQIAADEREAAIKAACHAVEGKIETYNTRLDCSVAIRATIEAMIDEGYKKQ